MFFQVELIIAPGYGHGLQIAKCTTDAFLVIGYRHAGEAAIDISADCFLALVSVNK